MKNYKSISVLLLMAIILLESFAINAHNVKVDGVYYNYNPDGATVSVTYEGTSYNAKKSYSGIVTIPSSIEVGGKTYPVTTIGKYAFYGCDEVWNVNIPNSVTWIDFCAFYGCSGLTNIILPNSVITIGEYAFCSCIKLTNIDFPNSVTYIGKGAFNNCNRLTSIAIGIDITYIGDYAFNGCTGLTSVTCLATTPSAIGGSNAFPSDITRQASLYVPIWSVMAYQAAIYWQNFHQIIGILTIDVFEVDGVFYRALSENTAMVIHKPEEDDYYRGNVVIPESVTYDNHTFAVVRIDDGAFEDCYELTNVVIGDTVESIGEKAFLGCTGLKSVTIGSGMTDVGTKAFYYCNALQTVNCRATVPPVMASSNCFSSAVYNHTTLRVPHTAIETYSSSDYWYLFATIEGWGCVGPGDVDGDGKVGIGDVTAMIDALLSGDEESIYLEYGDLNGNGRIDIGDVTSIIDMLINGNN